MHMGACVCVCVFATRFDPGNALNSKVLLMSFCKAGAYATRKLQKNQLIKTKKHCQNDWPEQCPQSVLQFQFCTMENIRGVSARNLMDLRRVAVAGVVRDDTKMEKQSKEKEINS